jgi:hypothetical protein
MSEKNISAKQNKCKPLYGSLPNRVLSRPLIQHRGQQQSLHISTSEFAILVCLLANARLADADADHQTALVSGKQKMQTQRQELAEYDEECKQVRIYNKKARRQGLERKPFPRKPEHLDYAVKVTGSNTHRRTRRNLRQQPSGSVTIAMSDYQIREQASLDRTKYRAQIDAACERLMRPVGGLGPVVLAWQDKQITISPEWLPTQNFTKIPLRVPRTPTALQMFLFLRWLGKLRGWIDRPSLCTRLGISRRNAIQRFAQAFEAVNDWLETLDDDYVETLQDEADIHLPHSWDVRPNKQHAVQFFAIQRRRAPDDDEPRPIRREEPARQLTLQEMADIERGGI